VDVQDDGQGLNPEKLIKKAIENKLITPNQNLSKQDIFQLIFLPGFSTKEVVTEVSGRGVGMDVVKRNIQQVQGSVNIESEVGKGSVFSIKIPLTLAIIDAMIVKSGEDKFVVPLVHVHETVQVNPQFLKQTSSLGEVLLLRGENLPSFRLSHLLKKKNTVLSNSIEVALIIRHESLSFAIIVDDILNQQSVVVKPLGPELNQIKGFSGSVILGDGKPSLILEPSDLVYQKAS
jgi:two-component system chemotaxis sensor kinase CheA